MRPQRALLVLLVASLASLGLGCSHRPIGHLTRDNDRIKHIITVDPDGVPVDPTTYHELAPETFEEQLRTIADGIDTSGKSELLVFMHGGLNNRAAGQQHVDELLDPMSKAGYYPVFLNWNSDLVDTSIEDLLYIRQGRAARYLGPVPSPLAVFIAVGSGLLRAPLVWGQMLSSDLNATGIEAVAFSSKRNSEALAGDLLALYRSGDPSTIPLSLPSQRI